MRTDKLFDEKVTFSLEIFPPKRTAPIGLIYDAIEQMSSLQPDFISVTYGAGGSEDKVSTVEIASAVKHKYGIESVAHLPGLHLSREEVLIQLDSFKEHGIENILALRGDENDRIKAKDDFRHADELVAFIREHGDFNIIGACYPEGHPDASDIGSDIENLKRKVDAGASHLISQLFFDNEYFYVFQERVRRSGIDVPIEAGIMPVVNKKQIERMVSLCGASLPEKFTKMMEKYEHNPEAMRDAGIAYAVNQIVDLAAHGVDGIHLYTMNNPEIARRISEAVRSLLIK